MSTVEDKYPISWLDAPISEVATINPKLPFENLSDNLIVSFLPMKCVEEVVNHIYLNEERELGQVKKGYTSMIDGDVILAKITPCMENGKMAVVHSLKNQIAFGSTEFHVFRCEHNLLNKFLFYYLVQQSFRQDAARHMTGAVGQRRVPKSFFENKSIPIPPLPEQHRIVARIEELFASLDAGIEALKTAQLQLKVYRQAVLKYAFEGRLTNPDLKAGELPEEWSLKKVGDCAFVTKLAGFEFTKYVNYKGHGEIPVIRAQNVSKNGFVEKNFIFVDRKTLDQLPRSRVNGGELLMVFVGAGLGNVGIVPSNRQYFLGPNVAKISFNDDVSSKYAFYFFTSRLGFGNVSEKQKATAQGSISMGNIRDVEITLPQGIDHQNAIVQEIESRLSVCDEMEQSIIESLQHAEALRQSILKKAFEGRLVPQDQADEPASVLLERIAQANRNQQNQNRLVKKPYRNTKKQSQSRKKL